MTTTVKIIVDHVQPGKAVKISNVNGAPDLIIGAADPREVTVYQGTYGENGKPGNGNRVLIEEVDNVLPEKK